MKETKKISILAMNVTTDFDRRFNFDKSRLFYKDTTSLKRIYMISSIYKNKKLTVFKRRMISSSETHVVKD